MIGSLLAGSTIRGDDHSTSVQAVDDDTVSDLGSTKIAGTDVSFVAPKSGYVLAFVGGGVRSNGANDRVNIELQVREDNVSGSIVQEDDRVINGWTSSSVDTSNYQYGGRMSVVPSDRSGLLAPLEPGRTYFARTMLFADTGGSGRDVFNQKLIIVPLPLGQVYSPVPMGLDNPRSESSEDSLTQTDITAGVSDPDFGSPEVHLTFRAPESGKMLVVVGGGLRGTVGGRRLRLFGEVREDDVNGNTVVDIGDDLQRQVLQWTSSSFGTNRYQYGSDVGLIGAAPADPLEPGRTYFVRIGLTGASAGTRDAFNRNIYAVAVH